VFIWRLPRATQPRYYAAQCQAKEVTCEGTAVIYGVAISGIFFASVALIPFTASGFIRNFVLARAYMGLAMCLTGLSMLLSIAALAWWCWYIDVMNEPRQARVEIVALFAEIVTIKAGPLPRQLSGVLTSMADQTHILRTRS